MFNVSLVFFLTVCSPGHSINIKTWIVRSFLKFNDNEDCAFITYADYWKRKMIVVQVTGGKFNINQWLLTLILFYQGYFQYISAEVVLQSAQKL